jgi:ubiquitin C-terminal hydrolase
MKLLGFINLGNTCYFNSVLQCFINDIDFQKIIKENKDHLGLNEIISNIDFTNEIEHISFNYNLSKVFKILTGKQFVRFQQHDAHEYILFFLDLIVENYKFENISPFTNLYHGQTKTTIKCCNCKNINHIYEDFNTINLNVNENCKLEDIFIKYLTKEVQSDPDNLYFCDICKKNCISEKKISLNKLPKKLILVLKRYSSECKSKLVIYPNTLCIKEDSELKRFKLNSVINHFGNLYDGHYTTSINICDNWYFIDDNSINSGDFSCDINAYILFYSI